MPIALKRAASFRDASGTFSAEQADRQLPPRPADFSFDYDDDVISRAIRADDAAGEDDDDIVRAARLMADVPGYGVRLFAGSVMAARRDFRRLSRRVTGRMIYALRDKHDAGIYGE